MKNIKSITRIFAAILLLASALSAKTRATGDGYSLSQASSQTSSGKVSANNALSATGLETRLRPALEARVNFRRSLSPQSANNPSINQRDLFALMKVWNSLSPEFRALYMEATAIPKNYDSYASPGGNFKVFYTTAGRDSVSRLDTAGYGVVGQPDRWRERRSGANGVPDYIDEAAFALDSAWSMEVARFGFPKPKAAPAPDGSTARYSVLIAKSNDYGVTIPVDKSSSEQAGFTSYIEINGNWSGREWAGLGYNERPYDALRVTCAHEFLHSIQYSMVWTINLDNLSYGWLEGSAVLMEELAFPEINDYLQYISSYFSNPRIPLLSDNEDYVYMNSIVLKYLYERGVPGGGNIGIVKAVHDNNLAQRGITFHKNITKAVSEQAGREWAAVLGGFHAESYFTGARARPWTFVSDAGLMGTWRAPTASTGADTSANVGAYSTAFFMYRPQPGHSDTLALSIGGQRDALSSGVTWGAGAIVAEGTGDSLSLTPITVNQTGNGRFVLAGWNGKGYCLLVATNAGASTKRITVKITTPDDTAGIIKDPTTPIDSARNAALKISPNKVKLRGSTPIRIAGGAISEATVVALNGKIIDRWSASGKAGGGGSAFITNTKDGSLEWSPATLKRRAAPGIYFITASSTNPDGKRSTQRRKIMLLPADR
jgi:hypothetical protein